MTVALRVAPLVLVGALLQVTAIGGDRIVGAELDILFLVGDRDRPAPRLDRRRVRRVRRRACSST